MDTGLRVLGASDLDESDHVHVRVQPGTATRTAHLIGIELVEHGHFLGVPVTDYIETFHDGLAMQGTVTPVHTRPIPPAHAGNHRLYINLEGPTAVANGQTYERTGKYLQFKARLLGTPTQVAHRPIHFSFETVQRLTLTGPLHAKIRDVVDEKARPCFYQKTFSYPEAVERQTDGQGETDVVLFYPSGSGGDQYRVVARLGAKGPEARSPVYEVHRKLRYLPVERKGQRLPPLATLQGMLTPAFIELEPTQDNKLARMALVADDYDVSSWDCTVVYYNLQPIDVRITYKAAKYYSGNADEKIEGLDASVAFTEYLQRNLGPQGGQEATLSAMAHEIGRCLGNVRSGLANHTKYGSGGHHCTDPQCFQYWATLGQYNKRFCPSCVDYLRRVDLDRVRKVSSES